MKNADHNRYPKIAVINDLSGFGRCSLAVALPVISRLRVQCCPMPTAIFSSHTGFKGFHCTDMTSQMRPYMAQWADLGLRFDGILSGFLGSVRQIEIVESFFREFHTERTVIVVDPVMGDYGRPYVTYTADMCHKMRTLVSSADIITPNLTEACILTDTPYHEGHWTVYDMDVLAKKLQDMGPSSVVITGIARGNFIANYCRCPQHEPQLIRTHKIGNCRSGTGDIFASIIAADAVVGVPFAESVRRASSFIRRCIALSTKMGIPETDGVCFEGLLGSLRPYIPRIRQTPDADTCFGEDMDGGTGT